MRSLRRVFPALLLLAAAVSVTSALAAPAPVVPQTRAAPSAPAAYQPRIKPYADEFGAVFSTLSSGRASSIPAAGLLIAGFCFSAWLLVKEGRRNPLVIEPFDVPKEMQDAGLT